MALGLPYGAVPYGGVYPPAQEPPLNATFVTIGFTIAVADYEPVDTALGGNLSVAEFGAVLRPWFLGDGD